METPDLASVIANLDADQAGRLRAFVAALLAENERVNLTAVRDADTAWRVHVEDSLALLTLLNDRPIRSLLDLGSGGGVPGLPLACVLPNTRITLLDATAKKIAACDRIAGSLALTNVSCIAGRAEDLAHEAAHREKFDAVTARAVAKLPLLIEWAAGFLINGGSAFFFKTPAAEHEIADARRAAEICRMGYVVDYRYRLTGETDDRVIFHYEKLAPLPIRLPRSSQAAQQKPL
ncbi:MAG: 16S rRNA (guanine(527)-N(7))-methyltransferase RsmG [Phycisphaerales bacterium]|nr:16S rRNA (guanine(527)-N(7))-methyltransferase RsmG [Phycisphaerales bacterium]